ncbi:polysaccharide deacetylase family protein [Vagococcus sp.]|uniref:polysaccharide deacetylase family protein n=1 Tax=Vagococcus sp. TaxID=1933889 RepID=UPI003F978F42
MKKWIWLLSIILVIELGLVGYFYVIKEFQTEPRQVASTKVISHIEKTVPKTNPVLIKKLPFKKWEDVEGPTSFPILMYHSLMKSDDGNTLKIDPEEFEQQMKWLHDNQYYTLTTKEAYQVLSKNKAPSKKMVWLTFDDGYLNNYTEAFRILKKYKLNGTINYITSKLGSSNYFSVEQMKEMKKSGVIDIQSHTVNHINLDEQSDQQIKEELIQSKKWLDETLNQSTQLLCYPAGRYDERVQLIAKEAGYDFAITTDPGLATSDENFYSLKRVRINPGLDYTAFGAVITN